VKQLTLSLLLIISVGTIYAQEAQLIYASSTTTNNSTITTGKSSFRLGDRVMTIVTHGAAKSEPYVLVSLHNDEFTSILVAKDFIKKNGGMLVELQNQQQRLIHVNLFDKMIAVDPNRIFTEEGRMNALRSPRDRDQQITSSITNFSQFILNEIPANKVVVAMHNNTNKEYSIRSYQRHAALKKDALMVHVNKKMDADDFFFTSSRPLFDKLKEQNFNVVLQSPKAYDDGSLSIYFGKMNIPYVNIETQLGHDDVQKQMLKSLVKILETLE
jgi:hypothetical protein